MTTGITPRDPEAAEKARARFAQALADLELTAVQRMAVKAAAEDFGARLVEAPRPESIPAQEAAAGTGASVSAEGFTAETGARGIIVAALVYVSEDGRFPAFRRWCLDCAADDAAMAHFFAAMDPSALQGLATALSGDEDQP
jgi:hypothetical protein